MGWEGPLELSKVPGVGRGQSKMRLQGWAKARVRLAKLCLAVTVGSDPPGMEWNGKKNGIILPNGAEGMQVPDWELAWPPVAGTAFPSFIFWRSGRLYLQFQQGPEGGAPPFIVALQSLSLWGFAVSICTVCMCLSRGCACGGDDGELQRQENEAGTEPRGKVWTQMLRCNGKCLETSLLRALWG